MSKIAAALQIPDSVAKHRVSLHGDILHIEFIGALDLGMMKQLVPIYQACIAHFGYLLLMMDVSRSSGFDADARRYSVNWAKDYASVQSAAVYGAPVFVRSFLILLNRATFLLSKGTAAELNFVSSFAEGQTWLDGQRSKLQQAAAERLRAGG